MNLFGHLLLPVIHEMPINLQTYIEYCDWYQADFVPRASLYLEVERGPWGRGRYQADKNVTVGYYFAPDWFKRLELIG